MGLQSLSLPQKATRRLGQACPRGCSRAFCPSRASVCFVGASWCGSQCLGNCSECRPLPLLQPGARRCSHCVGGAVLSSSPGSPDLHLHCREVRARRTIRLLWQRTCKVAALPRLSVDPLLDCSMPGPPGVASFPLSPLLLSSHPPTHFPPSKMGSNPLWDVGFFPIFVPGGGFFFGPFLSFHSSISF